MSLPAPPVIVSLPTPPSIVLSALFPAIVLLSALPVPLIAPEPISAKFSTLAPRLYEIVERTSSVPPADASVTASPTAST